MKAIIEVLEYIQKEAHHFPPERRSTLKAKLAKALASARILDTITEEDRAAMVHWIHALENPIGLPYYSDDIKEEYLKRAAMWRRFLGMEPRE